MVQYYEPMVNKAAGIWNDIRLSLLNLPFFNSAYQNRKGLLVIEIILVPERYCMIKEDEINVLEKAC